MIKCNSPFTFTRKSSISHVGLRPNIHARDTLNKHCEFQNILPAASGPLARIHFSQLKGPEMCSGTMVPVSTSTRQFPWHSPSCSHPARMRVFNRHARAQPPTSAVLRDPQTQYKPFWNTGPWGRATLLSIRPSFLRRNPEAGHWNPI